MINYRNVKVSYVLYLRREKKRKEKQILFDCSTGVGKSDGYVAVEDTMELISSELSTTLIYMR